MALTPNRHDALGLPVFPGGASLLGLTRFRTEAERNALAGRVAVNSFFLLLASLVVGSHVLEFFGISLPIVRIGGGLVVAAFGWQLLNSGVSSDGDHAAASQPSQPLDTFYPYTMPLTVGPGSISATIAAPLNRFFCLPRTAADGFFLWRGSLPLLGFVLLRMTHCIPYPARHCST